MESSSQSPDDAEPAYPYTSASTSTSESKVIADEAAQHQPAPEWAVIDPMTSAAASAALKKEKGRVRFNSNAAATGPPVLPHVPRPTSRERRRSPSNTPRPSALRAGSSGSIPTLSHFHKNEPDLDADGITDTEAHERAQERARERAKQVAEKVQRGSPSESRNSAESFPGTAISDGDGEPHQMGIPLQNLNSAGTHNESAQLIQLNEPAEPMPNEEAHSLVRSHTRFEKKHKDQPHLVKEETGESSRSVHAVPTQHDSDYYDGVYTVPPPQEYRGGVLSQLLKLYKPAEQGFAGGSGTHSFGHKHTRSMSSTAPNSGSGSGSATPSRRKWYEQNRSQETLANLIEASARLANPNMGSKAESQDHKHKKRPGHKRATSASRISAMWQKEEARITVHIAETLARQGYIIKLCRALMLFGAPTHRLEEYLSMTARVLEIEGQFLYLPGCMIISFDDKSTHTTEVRIVRVTQGIDLGKLKDVHHVYKEVMHDVIGVEEGTERLEVLIAAKNKFSPWLRVLIFGLTSATAAPFSFKARLIDLPIIFCFGCLVGWLQLIVAPMSNLYSNVFEVTSTVLVSFMARAFGSINNGNLFCFSSLAQSGIVMLLPGYAVLCSSLELQSRAIVPGSIRIVYAIIYSLLIGFGITIGAALWGVFDSNATSATVCQNPLNPYYGFIFVPFFIICIAILYQAKWTQMPVMIVIAFTGYVVNFFSGRRFSASPQIANTLGALCVGVLANLYSRLRHGVAAATLIPAIFVQVPGGLASTGGLLSGIQTANLLTNKTMEGAASQYNTGQLSSVVFDVAASMVQIAIGIAVGLFISAILVYPLGKSRSGLFSF